MSESSKKKKKQRDLENTRFTLSITVLLRKATMMNKVYLSLRKLFRNYRKTIEKKREKRQRAHHARLTSGLLCRTTSE